MSGHVEVIKITEIKSPSQFFYLLSDDPKLKLIKQLEVELSKIAAQREEESEFHPSVGQICAFFHTTLDKWIRVRVDGIESTSGVQVANLWSLDCGLSLRTENFTRLVEIPEKLKASGLNLIRAGCLNVLPAKEQFDYFKMETLVTESYEWSSKATELIENFVRHAKELSFVTTEMHDNIHFGDIEATNDTNVKFSLRKTLLAGNHAVAPEPGKLYEKLLTLGVLKPVNDSDESQNSTLLLEPPGKSFKATEKSLSSKPACNFEKIMRFMAKKGDAKASSSEAAGTAVHKPILRDVKKVKEDKENNNDADWMPLCHSSVDLGSQPKKATASNEKVLEKATQQLNPIISSTDIVRLFVHGKYLQSPLQSIIEANFHEEIHRNLYSMNHRTVYRLQSYSWPSILEGRAMLIVNSPKSGKTFSYLPAILSSILFEDDNETPSAQGPIGIIIVRSSRDVEIIYNNCSRLVPREKMKIIKAFGGWNCDNKKVDLLNGCDLLITTPPCFSRLAQGDVIRMFNKKRIKFLVFDGLDSMNDIFETEIKQIIKTCTRGEKHPELNPQLIVTTTSWMDYLRSYLNLMCDPIVVIGSFIEAALYAKCKFNITKNSLDEKVKRLKAFLMTNKWQSKKTLIVVNNQTEINNVTNCLNSFSINFICVDNKTTIEDVNDVNRQWSRERNGSMKVLLATDDALANCTFSCVEVLIHFSLPGKWTAFSRRFATMSETFLDISQGKTTERPTTMIMLDEFSVAEIPRLMEFAKNRQVLKEIPEDIRNLVERINDDCELRKRDPSFEHIMPMCSNIFQFGECKSFSSCKKRHVFTDIDKSVNIPCDGLIKFEYVGVQNPSHYAVKVLQYMPAGTNKWISCERKIQKIEESLAQLQEAMKETNLIQAGVKTNDMCAVFCPTSVKWFRCRVLEKQAIENSDFKAIVHLIDDERKMIVKSSDLKVLPDSLKLVDPLLTNLRIVNLVPYDKDQHWDRETSSALSKYFNSKENLGGNYLIAKVEFAVQNVMFAETFEIRSRVDVDVDITKFSLKINLLKKNFCLKDETVADKLKGLMMRAGFYVPPKRSAEITSAGIETLVDVKKDEAQPRWKHLTVGNEYQVQIKHFESPDMFYIRLDGTGNKVLRKLVQRVESCCDRIHLKAISEGDFCLAVKEDQKPQRGIVTKINNDETVKIFLLDAGDAIDCRKNEIFKLSASAINAMPFQAVQCRLIGVKPRYDMDKWLPRPASAFRDFVMEMSVGKMLKLKVIARHKNIYDVKLFHPDSHEELRKIAIEEKFADADNCSTTSDESAPAAVIQSTAEDNLMKLLQEADDDDEFFASAEVVKIFGPGVSRVLQIDKLPAVDNRLNKEKELIDSVRDDEKLKETKLQTVLPSTLFYIHKHPKIEWRQDEVLVMLTILATDCITYSLEVDDSSLKVRIVYEEERYEYTVIQLYGVIEANHTSHEKTGGKIIVRLLKSLTTANWPRLSKLNEHNRFITSSLDPAPKLCKGGANQKAFMARPAGDSDDGLNVGDQSSDDDAHEMK